eukprot:500557_1
MLSVLLLLTGMFGLSHGKRDCNSAFLNISITDDSVTDEVNLFAVGACTTGSDEDGLEISQRMECVDDIIYQYMYPNANCSDEPFMTNENIPGYCGGQDCTEYAQVTTYLSSESLCANYSDNGWLVLPMLMRDCYTYDFQSIQGKSYKVLCDDTSVNLGIFSSSDCSDKQYTAYELYIDGECIDGEYADVLSCPNIGSKAKVQITILISAWLLVFMF